jgi:Xaa-Pro aminopeptidase
LSRCRICFCRFGICGEDRVTASGQGTRPTTGIPASELEERRERLLEHVRREGLTGYVVFDQHYIQYLTGFWFLSTERPVVVAQSVGGDMVAFVPEFEVERVRAETAFEAVESYPEYPGVEHPMIVLARVLADLGVTGAIGTDQDGYPGILGYQGPALSEVTNATVAAIGAVVEGMMVRKSETEIALIRQSARWCEHAHRLLQEYTRPGVTEAEASLRAGHEATIALLEAVGDSYGGQLASSDGVQAGYRGQIGYRSSWAHAIAHNIEFQPGDVLVTETSAPIWGYNAELERAMVIGPPTDEMRRLFDHAVAAQQVAFDALRPGVTCADVDGAVMRYFEDNDLLPYWRQHTGHAIGLRNHEAPFLDLGDPTPVEPGMVFTIEPGVYDATVGGFRHSDTVVVTPDGIEILTDYPRDIESLTIPV